MLTSIQQQLDDLWDGRHGDSLDETLMVYEELNSKISKEHIESLKSFADKDDLGFWVRELITITLLEIGGSQFIPFGLEVLYKNSLEEHDSDALQTTLIGAVEESPSNSKEYLEQIIKRGPSYLRDEAEWLL